MRVGNSTEFRIETIHRLYLYHELNTRNWSCKQKEPKEEKKNGDKRKRHRKWRINSTGTETIFRANWTIYQIMKTILIIWATPTRDRFFVRSHRSIRILSFVFRFVRIIATNEVKETRSEYSVRPTTKLKWLESAHKSLWKIDVAAFCVEKSKIIRIRLQIKRPKLNKTIFRFSLNRISINVDWMGLFGRMCGRRSILSCQLNASQIKMVRSKIFMAFVDALMFICQ